MFLFRKNYRPRILLQNSPEVIAAREYLNQTHKTLIPGSENMVHPPFKYISYSKHGKYTRYYFCEGVNKRIIYIVLCEEERNKIIQMFTEKMKERFPDYDDSEFKYKDTLKGMFVGPNPQHRFFSTRHSNSVAFMSDSGDIHFPTVLSDEDMD